MRKIRNITTVRSRGTVSLFSVRKTVHQLVLSSATYSLSEYNKYGHSTIELRTAVMRRLSKLFALNLLSEYTVSIEPVGIAKIAMFNTFNIVINYVPRHNKEKTQKDTHTIKVRSGALDHL